MPKTKTAPKVFCGNCRSTIPESEILMCEVCELDVCPKCRSNKSAFRHPVCEDATVTDVKMYPVEEV
jgi:hypothetical protein